MEDLRNPSRTSTAIKAVYVEVPDDAPEEVQEVVQDDVYEDASGEWQDDVMEDEVQTEEVDAAGAGPGNAEKYSYSHDCLLNSSIKCKGLSGYKLR